MYDSLCSYVAPTSFIHCSYVVPTLLLRCPYAAPTLYTLFTPVRAPTLLLRRSYVAPPLPELVFLRCSYVAPTLPQRRCPHADSSLAHTSSHLAPCSLDAIYDTWNTPIKTHGYVAATAWLRHGYVAPTSLAMTLRDSNAIYDTPRSRRFDEGVIGDLIAS